MFLNLFLYNGTPYVSETNVYLPVIAPRKGSESNALVARGQVSNMLKRLDDSIGRWHTLFDQLRDPLSIWQHAQFGPATIDQEFAASLSFTENFHKFLAKDFRRSRSLRDRVEICLKMVAPTIGFERSLIASLAKKLKEQRNLIAHSDQEFSKKLDPDLYKYVSLLRLMNQSLIMQHVFEDHDFVRDIVRGRREFFILPTGT